MDNLADALSNQIERCHELLEAYKEIGIAGNFAAMMIKEDVSEAIKALASGDIVKMINAHNTLERCS